MSELPGVKYTFKNETAGDTGTWRILSLGEVEEALSTPYDCQLRLAQKVADKEPNIDGLLGDACVITMQRPDPAKLERKVHGIISRVAYMGRHHDQHVIEIRVVPALWSLSQRSDTRIFQEKDVPTILKEVIEAGLKPYGSRTLRSDLMRKDYPVREYCVQYGETDLEFIHRLMYEEGIAYYFDHSGDAEEMVLIDVNDKCAAVKTVDGKDVKVADGDLKVETISAFDWRRELQTTSVVVRDYDWTQPKLDLTREARAEDDKKLDREHYEASPVVAAHKYDGTKYGQENAQTQANFLQQGKKAREKVVVGESNLLCLAPGTVFTIDGHERKSLDGTYLVTMVSHFGGDVGGELAVDEAAAGGGHMNAFECIPVDAQFRPEKPSPRLKINGPLTATVVGPAGNEEVHTDKHGRIKVQFHWDRLGKNDDKSSCWMRVVQSWAGAGFGTMFIPRIGMEVVVQFVDGDPDRPLVTGCVYNGQNPPPYDLPDDKTKSGIHTRSSPGGLGRNELFFEDAKGSEEIYMHAQKDRKVEIKNNDKLTVDKDRIIHIKGDKKEVIDGSYKLAVLAKNSFVCDVDGNMVWVVDGDVFDTFKKKYTKKVTGLAEETYDNRQYIKNLDQRIETIDKGLDQKIKKFVKQEIKGNFEKKTTGNSKNETGGNVVEKIIGGFNSDIYGPVKYKHDGIHIGARSSFVGVLNIGGNIQRGLSYNNTNDVLGSSSTSAQKWSGGIATAVKGKLVSGFTARVGKVTMASDPNTGIWMENGAVGIWGGHIGFETDGAVLAVTKKGIEVTALVCGPVETPEFEVSAPKKVVTVKGKRFAWK